MHNLFAAWRVAEMSFVGMAEVRGVGIADLVGNLRHLPAPLQQKPAGQLQALLAHVLQNRPAKGFAKSPAQGGFAHAQLTREAGRGGRGR